MSTDTLGLERYRQFRRDQFIEENFKIVDKAFRLVPFRFQPTQRRYWGARTRRDRILKHRQGMFSSVVLADVLSEAILNPGLTALFILQKPEQETIAKHRDRARLYFDNVQPQWKPELRVDSFHQMQFGFPNGIVSTVYFGSAGSLSIGRGETLNRVVREELGEWEDEEVEASSQMLLGLPEDSRVIDLGTPKRMDSAFYRLCQDAKTGRSPYKLHVWPWFLHHEYVIPEGSYRVPEILGESRGAFTPNDEEQDLVARHSLTLEQLRWRRVMTHEAGGLQAFWQEYLEDDVRCWGMAGTPAMPTLVLDRLMGQVRDSLSLSLLPFRNDYGGRLKVWLLPEAGEAYCIGIDPAEGLSTSHDSALVLRRVRDWAHCVRLAGKISPEEMGGIGVELARWYNNALVLWERNSIGAACRAKIVGQLRYPYCYRHKGEYEGEGSEQYGFPTSRFTKKPAILKMAEWMRSGAFHTFDQLLLEQYRALQDLGDDRYNTDQLDVAMADILCLQGREQAMRFIGPKPEPTSNLPQWLQRDPTTPHPSAARSRREARRRALQEEPDATR